MHNKKLTTVAAAILGLTMIVTPVQAQLTGLVMQILRPALESAVKGMGIPEPAPFVDSAIAFIEGNTSRAVVSFIAGLVNNRITDPEQATKIVNGIAGASAAAGAALYLSGDRETGKKLASFAFFMINNPTFKSWREAVAAGKDVRIENGQMVVGDKGGLAAAPQAAPQAAPPPAAAPSATPPKGEYAQSRSDEVSPNLNIKHGRPGAQVMLDENLVEVSKYEEYMFSNLPAGKHLITVRTAEEEGSAFVFVNPGRKTQSGYDTLAIDVTRAGVMLEVDPGIAGCSVWVDGMQIGETPLITEILTGSREISIESEWASPFKVTVAVKAGQPVRLAPAIAAKGALVVSGPRPDGATVSLNGATVDEPGKKLYLEPGRYTLEVRHATIKPYRVSVLVEKASVTEHAPKLEYITGAVSVTGIPPMVSVSLDGAELPKPSGGKLELTEVVIGERELSFLSPFSQAREVAKVIVREGKTTSVSTPTGQIALPALPPETQVTVNGKPLTEGIPAEGGPFTALPGEYVFILKGRYLPRVEATVECEAGRTVSPELDLPRLGVLAVVFGGAGYLKYRVVGTGDGTGVRSASGGITELLPPGDYELLAWNPDDTAPGFRRMFTIEPWKRTEITSSLPYSREFMLAKAQSQLGPLEREMRAQRSRRRSGLMTLLVGGGVSLVGGGVSWLLGDQAYAGYMSATNAADAQAYRRKVEAFTTGLNVSIAAGVSSVAASGLLFVLGRTSEAQAQEADELRRRIEELSAAR